MAKTYSYRGCPVCKRMPTAQADGHFRCDCAEKKHEYVPSASGTPEEKELLANYGYAETKNVTGDIYYVSNQGWPIIHLYVDGTWSDESRDFEDQREGETLLAFLQRLDAATRTVPFDK